MGCYIKINYKFVKVKEGEEKMKESTRFLGFAMSGQLMLIVIMLLFPFTLRMSMNIAKDLPTRILVIAGCIIAIFYLERFYFGWR